MGSGTEHAQAAPGDKQMRSEHALTAVQLGNGAIAPGVGQQHRPQLHHGVSDDFFFGQALKT